MEAELKKKDQELRQSAQKLQEQKLAMQAAKEMAELGLSGDEQEAKITKMYAETLKTLVEAGIASGEQAMEAAAQIEQEKKDREGEGEVNIDHIPDKDKKGSGENMGEYVDFEEVDE